MTSNANETNEKAIIEYEKYHKENRSWSVDKLLQSSYKDLGSPTQVEERFLRHLLSSEHCRRDLHALLHECSVVSRDYSIPLDAFDLIQRDPILGYMLLQYPQTLLPLLENAVVRAQSEILREQEQARSADGGSSENDDRIRIEHNGKARIKGCRKGDFNETDNNDDETRSTTKIPSATTRVHARLVHLPPQCCKTSLGMLDASDVGKIWQVSGTVVRVGPVQMYESARTYKCVGVVSSSFGDGRWRKGGSSATRRSATTGGSGMDSLNDIGTNVGSQRNQGKAKSCGCTFTIHADLEHLNNALQQPDRCPLKLHNSSSERCPGNKFEVVPEGSVHTDYQEIKIQETTGGAGAIHDTIPRSLLIKLQHDLVDHCQPGDEVVIVGILLAQWPSTNTVLNVECQVGMAMSAHSIRVVAEHGSSAWKHTTASSASMGGKNSNSVGQLDKYRKDFDAYWNNPSHKETPILARDFICQAVCPKLYGLQIIKLALLITLIGGVSSDAYLDHNRNHLENSPVAHETAGHDVVAEDIGPQAFQLTEDENSNKRSNATSYYGDHQQNQDHHSTNKVKPRNKAQAVKTRRRDMSHLLLVGDPGTGKSQFLRFAAALCPRSVLTTGVGTTSAGLTCAAVRDGSSGGKEFALEAGALVLADKGVCCIDEFGCIQKSDRTTIHEAMEQQTLSIAKAGIVCKLNCRTTIIAVMNPRDCLYDNHASLAVNTGLGTPLLSRFDLIFKLVDTSDPERDSNVTTYLLNRAIQGAGFDVAEPAHCDDGDETNTNEINPLRPWNMDKLRAYIAVVKDQFQPVISNDAALLLERHYEKCRSQVSNTIPVTVRFLESLIRLCQAHARLMYRNIVTLQDAVAVIQVMESTAFAYGGFDGVDAMDYNSVMYRDPMTTDFSPEADLDFLCFEYQILKRYNLLHRIDDDRRARALAAFESTSSAPFTNKDNWETLEQVRDHRVDLPRNNAQFSSYSQSTQHWTIPSQTATSQDHYGRDFLHPSTQSKRRRL